ncbi:MAG: ABC transporter permease, partial [Chitinophagaceae bacterium]
MVSNYFKSAWRNIKSHKSTSGIHIIGLTIGLTTCIIIGLFLKNELSFDRHQPMGKYTYRINLADSSASGVSHSGTTPYPLGNAFRNDFADFPVVASVHFEEDAFVLVSPEKILKEKRVLFAEPSVLQLFNISMSQGNAETTLAQPNHAVVSEETASRYFGTTDVIGKTFI